MHRVFVYGTLKRGYPNFEEGMTGLSYIGDYRTVIAFPLAIGGPWRSPALLNEPNAGQRVRGELFEADDGGLARLDLMEGIHKPTGYHRMAIEVENLADGTVATALSYFKRRDQFDVIHEEALESYPLDPGYVPARRRTT